MAEAQVYQFAQSDLKAALAKIRNKSSSRSLTTTAEIFRLAQEQEASRQEEASASIMDRPDTQDNKEEEPVLVYASDGKTLLSGIKEHLEAEDIKLLAGSKGTYLISELYMTKEYASILIRMEEGDNPALIASMVREDCRKYPRPTDIRVFNKFPFFMDHTELEQTLEEMQSHPDYQDIKTVTAFTGLTYLYSERHMKEKYAAKLADKIEFRLKYGH